MHNIIMAGGKSSRFGSEKLMATLCGRKVIEYTIEHMKSYSERFYLAVSHNALQTKNFLIRNGYDTVETPGNGYPEDIMFLLDYFSDDLLVLNGDSIFIMPSHISYFLSRFRGISQTGIAYNGFRKVYVGLNIAVRNSYVDLEVEMNFDHIHLNINTLDDLREASLICQRFFG